jgi:hypothetical protein
MVVLYFSISKEKGYGEKIKDFTDMLKNVIISEFDQRKIVGFDVSF